MRTLGLVGVLLLAAPAQEPWPEGMLARMGTTQFRHGGTPTGVAFLDATTLASSGGDGLLRVWEVPSGKQLRATPGLSFQFGALASDGKVLVATDRKHHFALWDARTGKPLRQFGYGAYPTGCAVQGDLFVFGTAAGVTVWDIDGQKPLRTLDDAKDSAAVRAIALSSDGSLTALARDGAIRLVETRTGKLVRDLPGPADERVSVLAFAPGKPRLLAATEPNGKTRLWDVTTGQALHLFARTWGTALAFAPDGKHLAIGGKSADEGIALVETATFTEVRRFRGGPLYLGTACLAISPDGKYLAASGSGSLVQVWEVATGKAVHDTALPDSGVRDMRLSPDGKLLVVGYQYLGTRVWDVATGQARLALSPEETGVPAGWGKDGRVLVGRPGNFDATFHWHDAVTGKRARAFRVPQSIHTLALTPDGATLVALTTNNGIVSVWDVAKGVQRYTVERPREGEGFYGLAVSPDGKRFATAGVVRDVATGNLVRTLRPDHQTTVNGVAFAPDGQTVATVSYRQVLLYEVEGTRPPRAIEFAWENRAAGECSVCFHPDGKRLAVGARASVALFDLASGKEVHRWTGVRGLVRQVCFTPDGKRLLAGADDGTVAVWPVP